MLTLLVGIQLAFGHSGGTDAYGCHAGTREYHCHGTPRVRSTVPPPRTVYSPSLGSQTATSTLSATARAICSDGTVSYSATPAGTCSHHGGVSVWLDGLEHAERDYSLSTRTAVEGPANAVFSRGEWRCGEGYQPVSGQCAGIPDNASVYGSKWYCNDGYRKVGESCVYVDPPDNASVYGSKWYCNDGYRKVGESCVPK